MRGDWCPWMPPGTTFSARAKRASVLRKRPDSALMCRPRSTARSRGSMGKRGSAGETGIASSPRRRLPGPMTSRTDALAMDRRFFAALAEGSREALERILADDFVLIDVVSGGEVPTAQLLDQYPRSEEHTS